MSLAPAVNIPDVALIFEGGGMRVSYTAAVVEALLAQDINFGWVAGISAGSSNLANYVSRDPVRARRSFVEFAADPNFGNLATFLRGKGLFNAEYIYEQTSEPGQALPFDFATFQDNPCEFRIGAFECDTGRSLYWGREDVDDLMSLLRRVRASSTMPVIMPPVDLDGHVYIDGALGPSGGIPLDAARQAGFTRFFIVLTQERGYHKSRAGRPGFFRQYYRKYPAVAEAINSRHLRYNTTREEVFDLESSGQAFVFAPEKMAVSNGTRDVAQLAAAYEAGLEQSRREIPAWRDFLGL